MNELETKFERLRSAAHSALFHYWNCLGECPEYRHSMAVLAQAAGFSDPASNDDIAAAAVPKRPLVIERFHLETGKAIQKEVKERLASLSQNRRKGND